jgi:hypothetical protein
MKETRDGYPRQRERPTGCKDASEVGRRIRSRVEPLNSFAKVGGFGPHRYRVESAQAACDLSGKSGGTASISP